MLYADKKDCRSIRLDHASLIDGRQDKVVKDSWIRLHDGKIDQIGQFPQEAPSSDLVLDVSGCTILPGLFNLHVHIQRRHLAIGGQNQPFRSSAPAVENAPDTQRIVWAVQNAWRELFGGVTTIRDCASKNRINIVLRDLIRRGQVRGPNVLACGFGIAATGGHETHRYQGAVEADGPDEIRKAVRTEIKHGADFIKFMASGGLGGMPEHEDPDWVEMGEDELVAGIREAHERGRRTTVHAMGVAAVHNALNAGIDCIEHGICLDEAALTLMKERGVHYVPTLSGIEAVARREEDHGDPALGALIRRRVVIPHRESVRQAAICGIRIGCGTDTFGDVVEELCQLQDCGLSVMDCLRAATGTAAEICGLEDRLGILACGRKADLLVVNGNPLIDLSTLRSIRMVIKDGMIVDPGWAIALV